MLTRIIKRINFKAWTIKRKMVLVPNSKIIKRTNFVWCAINMCITPINVGIEKKWMLWTKVTKANHVTSENGWWLDTGATIHISKDRRLYKTYEVIDDGIEVQMGYNIRTKVIGKGIIVLKFTFEKLLTLVNVLHIPDMAEKPCSPQCPPTHPHYPQYPSEPIST